MSNTRSISQRLISGGLWATMGKVVFALCTLALNALITRLLSPEEVGAYYLMLSIVSIGALIAQFGVHQAIIRVIAGGETGDVTHEPRRLVRINTLFHHSVKYRHPWELLSILTFGWLHPRVE